MRVEVILPKWGMTMQDGTIVSWGVVEGARVSEGDPIAVIETEKVETDLPSPATGTIVEIVVAEGAVVAVGEVIAWLESD
jgi:pyruvate/2-oxoglutarate dehydrogenase complex dihydrolipoamide acyltransferase (E2) component